MSIEKVRAYFTQLGIAQRIREFDVSSATVELAAQALNCEPCRIAKTLSFMLEDGAILVVAAGDAKVDNTKYKAEFGKKAKMLTPDEAAALMTTTVRNLSIDQTRRHKTHPRDELLPNLRDTTPFDPQAEADEAEQTFAEVMQIVSQQLSEQQQAILRLRDYEGRDYEEIAELLQMTPSAVRVNLSRARKTVREVYRQRHQT